MRWIREGRIVKLPVIVLRYHALKRLATEPPALAMKFYELQLADNAAKPGVAVNGYLVTCIGY